MYGMRTKGCQKDDENSCFQHFLNRSWEKKIKYCHSDKFQIHFGVGLPILVNIFGVTFLFICFSICGFCRETDNGFIGNVKWQKVGYQKVKLQCDGH